MTVLESVGQVQQISVVDGKATMAFAGIPGDGYDVQRAENVDFTATLTSVLTTSVPADGLFIFVDDTPPSSGAFYRLKYNP